MRTLARDDLQRWIDPGWREMLLAWWEGYDADRLSRAARDARAARAARAAKARAAARVSPAASPSATAHDALALSLAEARALETAQLDTRGLPVWSVERVQGAERLWGTDCIYPGEVEDAVDAVRPLALAPRKTVLDVSAGLGGRARALAGSFDAAVTGLETSPVLAHLAMARSRVAGMARDASVTVYDPATIKHDAVYDLVIGDRILHRIHQKEAFLDNLQAWTKGAGTVLLDDYVVEGTPSSWEVWNEWRHQEPIDVHPWTRQRLAEELVQRNLDLRMVEDRTAAHRGRILARIRALGDELDTGAAVDGPVLNGLHRELGLWWNRLRVLGAGLSLFRFVVHKPQE
jgi:2-polyprenyl-3-methyl-5-hydroxy-6-metoxy-1,4-benzoquinol methylase